MIEGKESFFIFSQISLQSSKFYRNPNSLDALISQLNGLITATETNNELSKAIYQEVSQKSSLPQRLSGLDQESHHHRQGDFKDSKKLLTIIRSQSQLLEDHKKALYSIENASRELHHLETKKLIRGDADDTFNLSELLKQFLEGVSDYQNLVSSLIVRVDNLDISTKGK